jgi:hypothetical protein
MSAYYEYSPLTTHNTTSSYITYNDESDIFVNTYSVLASKFIAAFPDEFGVGNDLRLAASSNLMIEAVDSVSMFVYETNGKFNYYSTSNDANNVRTDSLMMQSYSSNLEINGVTSKAYVIESGNLPTETGSILIKGTDQYQTVVLNDLFVMSGIDQQHFDTTHSNFRFEKPIVLNSMYVTQEFQSKRAIFDNDIFVGNSIYSCNLNLWKDIESLDDQTVTKVGFGFQINEKNQLEIIKYSKFNDGLDTKSISKKIATFGNNDINFDDVDDSNYLIFDSMGVTQSSNNYNLSALDTSLWQANADKKIYYMSNFVGINTTNPTCHLDVAGIIAADQLNVTSVNAESVVMGTSQIVSDERLKENIVKMSLDNCLSNILNLNVYNFNYIKNKDKTTGFVAQQVASTISDAVKIKELYGYTDLNVIDTNVILANLVGAVKKLAEKINI